MKKKVKRLSNLHVLSVALVKNPAIGVNFLTTKAEDASLYKCDSCGFEARSQVELNCPKCGTLMGLDITQGGEVIMPDKIKKEEEVKSEETKPEEVKPEEEIKSEEEAPGEEEALAEGENDKLAELDARVTAKIEDLAASIGALAEDVAAKIEDIYAKLEAMSAQASEADAEKEASLEAAKEETIQKEKKTASEISDIVKSIESLKELFEKNIPVRKGVDTAEGKSKEKDLINDKSIEPVKKLRMVLEQYTKNIK